jgi:ketosteroid isomerase-like protein
VKPALGTAGVLLSLALTIAAGPRPRSAVPGPGVAPHPAAEPPADSSIVQAERAFCRAAVERGIREAFLEYLADDAVVFRPGPVNARRWYLTQPPGRGVLTWTPERFEIAESGDLGYTTGPWEYRSDSLRQEPVACGHYISIWRRAPSGAWKIVLDAGISHARPDPGPGTPAAGKAPEGRVARPVPSVHGRRAIPYSTDKAYGRDAAARGRLAMFRDYAGEEVSVFRPGHPPGLGRDSALAAMPDTLRLKSWEPSGGGVSNDESLGFTYGTGQFAPRSWSDTRPDSAGYVRIWRRAPDRSWKLAVDWAAPLDRGRRD